MAPYIIICNALLMNCTITPGYGQMVMSLWSDVALMMSFVLLWIKACPLLTNHEWLMELKIWLSHLVDFSPTHMYTDVSENTFFSLCILAPTQKCLFGSLNTKLFKNSIFTVFEYGFENTDVTVSNCVHAHCGFVCVMNVTGLCLSWLLTRLLLCSL